jgi:hypothetical protein
LATTSTAGRWERCGKTPRLGLKDPRTWEKIAVVGDKDWLAHVLKAFGWMIPGEVRAFHLDELDAARAWVAD